MALAKPTQISVPFSSNGVKNTIPETATGSNLASMQEGFPVITMTDVDQGGMPPQGQDMNGILFDVTTAIQYQQAGGLFPYDATFAQAIDGYPLGALLTAADGSCLYQNTVSGNVSDPDNGGQGWSQILSSASITGKQDKLTPVQMDAVNSGITSARVAIYDSYANGKQDTLTFDNTPTSGSTNPVTSDGIYTALGTKQDTITVDAVPTSGSANPVQSGGVYDAVQTLETAVDGKVSKSGDTMAGSLKTAVSEFIQRTVDNLYNRFCGGTAYDKGASLTLFGKDHASQAGQVVQRAYDGTDSAVYQITPSGQFNFQNLPIENRSCFVGQSGNGVTAPWFKVGSFSTTTASSTTVVCLFDIQSALAGDDRHGLLYIKMRLLTNRVVDSINTTLEWMDAVNINPDDFVLVFNSDSTASYFNLYVKCPKNYLKYTFKILSEKSMLSGSTTGQSRTFALANNIANGSLASLPSGTQIVSKLSSEQPPYLLVVAGQSNAVGRSNEPSKITGSGKWWRYSTSEWVTGNINDLSEGIDVPVSAGVSDPMAGQTATEGGFVPALVAEINRITGREVYVINVARSGHSSVDWAVSENTSGSDRNLAKQQITGALAALRVKCEVLGTVWLQGESDVDLIYTGSETVSQYTSNTTSTVNWFKNLVGGGFFASKISYHASYSRDATVDAVNNALSTILSGISGARVVTDLPTQFRSEGLLYNTWHYLQAGYDRLGKAIAQGIMYASEAVPVIPKVGKKIAFSTNFKFPDHDAALAAAMALEPDGRVGATACYPQACTLFVKNKIRYLLVANFLIGGTNGQGGTATSTVCVLTIWNFDTGEYIGYRIAEGVFGEGLVAKTEGSTDYLYMISTSNAVVKKVLNLSGTNGSTLSNATFANSVKCGMFLSYCNGTWAVESYLSSISRNKSLTLYDDDWNIVGMVSIPRYDMDVFQNYTDGSNPDQWSLPRPQGVSIAPDGIHVFRGGAVYSSVPVEEYPLTDVGVDVYSWDGSHIKSSVCKHSLYLTKMCPMVGITAISAKTEMECEGGFIADDGTSNLLMVAGGTSGKIAVVEEFSTATGAVDFVDCLATNRSDLAAVSDKQNWAHSSDGYFYNPWTGNRLQTIDDVVTMCAYWGLDDITIAPAGQNVIAMTCKGTTLSSSTSCTINVKRHTPNIFLVTVNPDAGNQSEWKVTVASGYKSISSVVALGTVVTVVDSGTNYKRYSDGTQECWGRVRNNSADGVAVTYPKAFSARPFTIAGIDFAGANADGRYSVITGNATATGFTAKVAFNNTATANGVDVTYFARGNWSA